MAPQQTHIHQSVRNLDRVIPQLLLYWTCLDGVVVPHPQVADDVVEALELLLHLLVVGPALISSPGTDKVSHRLEDLVHPPHILVLKVPVEHFKEPVVSLLLGGVPVPHQPPLVLGFLDPFLCLRVVLLCFLLGALEVCVALIVLHEEMVEVFDLNLLGKGSKNRVLQRQRVKTHFKI